MDKIIFSETNIFILSKLVALVRRESGNRHRLSDERAVTALLQECSEAGSGEIADPGGGSKEGGDAAMYRLTEFVQKPIEKNDLDGKHWGEPSKKHLTILNRPFSVLDKGEVDKIKLDDPVGAIAVHLICGIWGTLAVGLFGAKAGFDQFLVQLVGVLSYAVFCIATSFIIIFVLKKTVGIRVSEREELEGLDAHEHQMDAYPDFRLNEH